MESKKKVLIVDDNEKMVEGLRETIRMQEDMQVVAQAADGFEGYALLQETKPDIV